MAGRIAITGATGFLGRHLVRQSIENGYEVRSLVRNREDAKGKLGNGTELVECSFEDPSSLKQAVKGCNLIIHAAAIHTRKLVGREEILRVNVEGTKALIESAPSLDAFLFVSSIRSMMTTRTSDITEETEYDFLKCDTPYGYSKYEAERLCLNYYRDNNLPLYIINPAVIIGPEDLCPSYNGQLILSHLKKKVVFVTRAMWNIADVRDVADAAFFVLKNGRVGERHIVCSANLLLMEFFRRIDEVSGQRKIYISVPYLPLKIAGYGFELIEKIVPGFDPPIVSSGADIARLMIKFSGDKLHRMGFNYRDVRETFYDTVKWFMDNNPYLGLKSGKE